MTSEHWRGMLLLLAIFLWGGLVGGATVRLRTTAALLELLRQPAPAQRQRYEQRMQEIDHSLGRSP